MKICNKCNNDPLKKEWCENCKGIGVIDRYCDNCIHSINNDCGEYEHPCPETIKNKK